MTHRRHVERRRPSAAPSSSRRASQSPRPPRARRPSLRSRELVDRCSCCVAGHRRRDAQEPDASCSARNGWRDLLLTPSILLLLAVGQAVVIITRNVDLSVGSVLGLTAYLTGRLFIDHPGSRSSPSSLAGLLVGAAARPGQRRCWSRFGKVPALVITLGTLYIYRGIVLHLGRQQPDQRLRHARRVPRLGTKHVLIDPGPDDPRGWSCSRSSATTCTPPAAAASSTRSAPTRTPPCSTACRYGAGCSARSSSAARWPASPASSTPPATAPSARSAGTGIELQAVGAAVIGGVAIFGGSGTVWGAAHRRLPAGHHQPRAADPRHPGLLAAGRRRRADPRRDRARPGARRCDRHASSSKRGTSHDHHRDRHARRARTYAAYAAAAVAARAAHPRGRGHRAAGRWSSSTRYDNVPNFDGPLTIYFLLLDIAPILLIALPMTLIIITGEIDLSVASIVGPEQRAARRPAPTHGMSIPVAGAGRARSSALVVRRAQRLPRRRTSGCRRSRSPSARSRSTAASRSACSAPRRSPTSPSSWTDLAKAADRRHRLSR